MAESDVPVPLVETRTDVPDPGLDDLVTDWLTVPDVADRLGVTLGKARKLIEDREVVAVRRGERRVVSVPAAFLLPGGEGPLPALRGTITVLSDAGFDDAEIIGWLFTPDDTLPGGPHPVGAIIGGFKTEVRRRAMEQM